MPPSLPILYSEIRVEKNLTLFNLVSPYPTTFTVFFFCCCFIKNSVSVRDFH